MNKFKIVSFFVITISLFLSCGRNKENADTIDFDREAAPVKVFTVIRQEFSRTLSYSGTLEAYRVAKILPETPGKIFLLHKGIGDTVKRDDHLVSMDNSIVLYQLQQANAGLNVAEANLNDAEKNWNRAQTLHSENAISDQQLEKTRLAFEAAEAQYKQTAANVDLLDLQFSKAYLKAPFDGMITQKGYVEGDMVNPSMARESIYTVMDISRIKVGVQVPQQEIGLIKKDQMAKLRLNTGLQTVFSGRVSIVNVAADPESKTFYVEVEFANDEGLLNPGTFGSIDIEVETHTNTLPVPKSAVIERKSLFVVKDGVAFKRSVSLGIENDFMIEVLSGITNGDVVVVEGGYTLTDSSKIRIDE